MSYQIKVGETDTDLLRIHAVAILKSDGLSPATGETGQPKISINGAAVTDTDLGALVESGEGKYYAELDATHVAAVAQIDGTFDTVTASFAFQPVQVVALDPALSIAAALTAQGLTTDRADNLDNLDVAVSTRAVKLTGAKTITITVNDQYGDPFPGYTANVYDASNTTFLGPITDDDSDGIIELPRNDGTYAIRIVADLFEADNLPETLIVTADAAVTYTGVRFVVPTAAEADLCAVYGFARDLAGVLVDDVEMVFTGLSNVDLNNTMHGRRVVVITGPNGTPDGDTEWTTGQYIAKLERLSTGHVSAPELLLDTNIDIPDAASVQLDTLTA